MIHYYKYSKTRVKGPFSKSLQIDFEDQLSLNAGQKRCRMLNLVHLGINCIQNFHFGRYIVEDTVGYIVLCRCVSGAVKRDFGTYIRQYTSPQMKILKMVILTLMHYLHFLFEKTVKMYFVVPTSSCIKPLASCIYSLVNQ